MSFPFGDKITIGETLPPPSDYREGAWFFEQATASYYWHNGTEWILAGGDPTVSNYDTYDDLRASSTPTSPIILVGGRAAAGDGGQGFFIRDPANRADNDGTVLVDADGHSWQRVFTGDVLAVWFFGSGTTVNRTQFMNLYDVVRTYHNTTTIDWYGVTLQDGSSSTLIFDFGYSHTVKNATVVVTSGRLEFNAGAPDTPGETVQVEWDGCTFTGQVRFTTSDNAASSYTHDSLFVDANIQIYGDAVVADSVAINTRFQVIDNGVLRNSVVRGYRVSPVHLFSGDAFVFGNQFYNIEPVHGATATVQGAARVINNTFWTHIPSGVANGGVNIDSTDGAIVANNRVYLYRFTYPYPMSLNNPRKATVVGNAVESHTGGGQDSTQWSFFSDADNVIVTGNSFITRGGSGNYGVRIRGGGKANTLAANNMFMNYGSHGGNGVERRDGTGNLKFVGNVFYNWGYAIRKIGTGAINGVFEGNSNAFSNCGAINDADYVNSSVDTVWS